MSGLEENDLIAAPSEIDDVFINDDQLIARVISATPRLKTITEWETGIDSIVHSVSTNFSIRWSVKWPMRSKASAAAYERPPK